MNRGPLVAPGLRRVLVDREAVPRSANPEDHSAAMFRAHVLAKVARLLADAGVDALLVKGAALALTVYEDPAVRPMGDLDLLVRPGDSDRAVAALVAGGGVVQHEPGRRYSAALSGEIGVLMHAGAMSTLVEVHTTLDKVVTRPIRIADLFARAAPAPSLPGLFLPAAEDHALLIALHAASHHFGNTAAFLDLELLFRRGLDVRILVSRAREWRLTAVMFATLSAMHQLGAASVDAGLVSLFDPGPLRRRLLENAAARGASKPGLGWMVSQIPLRDDPLTWLLGVGRYAAARVRDRGSPPQEAEEREYRVPAWARAIVALDRGAGRLENLRAGIRDEALLAWIPPAERASLTASIYEEQATYLPGGIRFDGGLFAWETRVLASPSFPRSGRVLLGAAGAGRELVALVERGFDVVAFDPCEPYAEAAKSATRSEKAQVARASYTDLVDAAAGRGGPLAGLVTGKRFDAVILGWGSLSHVIPSSAREELFRALRALAPGAPVLASFVLVTDPATPAAGTGRVRQGLRRVFAALGAPGVAEDRDHFFSHLGFFSYLSHDEVRGLAARTGYEIALFEDHPYPHALFVPKGGTSDLRRPAGSPAAG